MMQQRNVPCFLRSSSWCLFAALTTLTFLCTHQSADAFAPLPTRPKSVTINSLKSLSSTSLQVGDILGNLFGGNSSNDSGPKEVVNLPATVVKTGPLRFFLQIYLVGEQNNPSQGAWAFNNNDAGSLDMYYQDGTGMFSIQMDDNNIKVLRYGQKPSLEYVLQESVMVEGVLNELNSIAFEVDDIEEEKRLLQFGDRDIIEKALDSLPARSSSPKKKE